MSEPPRRRGRRERPAGPQTPPQPAWNLHRRRFEPTRVVSDDQLEAIHLASLRVLEETGMDFLHPEALRMWREAGAAVDGERVRLDREMIQALVASAPSEFTLHAPNPARDLRVGGDHVVFGAVASTPNMADRAGGRRPGNRADFRTLVKLSHSLNAIQTHGGYPVEPTDLHPFDPSPRGVP